MAAKTRDRWFECLKATKAYETKDCEGLNQWTV